jgi:DNA-binding PadR family transcriptional regulator
MARRIEQISGDRLSLNYGTVYPALLRLKQEERVNEIIARFMSPEAAR